MKVLADYHHGSLLRSLVLLFEQRLGMELYRPIGFEWQERGYWALSNVPATAKQYLDYDRSPTAATGTDGVYAVTDPGGGSVHKACTFDYFVNTRFEYVIASIPNHRAAFRDLVVTYQPRAKLIIHVGNNWNLDACRGHNVLASIAPQPAPGVNVLFYHQEFDLGIFAAAPCLPSRKIHSYVNVIKNYAVAWDDYRRLKRLLAADGYQVMAFGGCCPDGNKSGPEALAESMREAQFVLHVKPGGDGFGHVIHNAYAVGRPIITRRSHYRGQLAEQLMVPGTLIDVDQHGHRGTAKLVRHLSERPDELRAMGARAAERFREVVDYDADADAIAGWLATLD